MNIESDKAEFSIPAVEFLKQQVADQESTDSEEGVDHDGSIEQNHGVDAPIELQTEHPITYAHTRGDRSIL
jgi:hypothetical protein